MPTPTSMGLDSEGRVAGVALHLMSRLPGVPTTEITDGTVAAMAEMLARIHEVKPPVPFRTF